MAPLLRAIDNNIQLRTLRPLGPETLRPSGANEGDTKYTFELPLSELQAWKELQLKQVNWVRRATVHNNKKRKEKQKTNAGVRRDVSEAGEEQDEDDLDEDHTDRDVEKENRFHPYPNVGRKKQFEWTEVYRCDHAGKPRKKEADSDPKRSRKPSMKVGCNAKFHVRKLLNRDNLVEIEYHFIHNGHEAASATAMKESRMSAETRAWLQGMVDKGLDWGAIHNMLRLEDKQLSALEDSEENLSAIPESLRVGWQEAYNFIRKRLRDASRLDADGWKSLECWKQKLEAEGWKVLLKKDVIADSHVGHKLVYAIALISPWQQDILKAYHQTLCLDSTHDTCFSVEGKDEKAFLYTLVVKHQGTGKGVPAAFMITPSETQYPIIDWFLWLRQEFEWFRPRTFMIDCSDTEAAAIKAVFPPSGPSEVAILYCYWHLMKAISEQAKKKITTSRRSGESRPTQEERNRGLRAKALSDFVKVLEQRTPAEFEMEWEQLKREWQEFPVWINYLAAQWIVNKTRWGRAWRLHAHSCIDTNNFIECWHHQLKVRYLRLMRRQRVDFLILVLSDNIVPDYRRDTIRITTGFQSRRKDKAEQLRFGKAQAVSSALAVEMVREIPDGSALEVQSFMSEEVWYSLGINAKGDLHSCTCTDYEQNAVICKHIWLAARITTRSVSYGPSPISANIAPPPLRIPTPEQQQQHLGSRYAIGQAIREEFEKVSGLVKAMEEWSVDEFNVPESELVTSLSHLTSARRALNFVRIPHHARSSHSVP